MSKTNKVLIPILFAIYAAVLIKLLIFRHSPSVAFYASSRNFVPFKTIINYLTDSPTTGTAFRNLIGNILIFVPLGIFVPLLGRSSNWKSVLIFAFATSATAELIQGIFKVGILDVDDILLNVLGAIIGYGLFVCVKLLIAINKENK